MTEPAKSEVVECPYKAGPKKTINGYSKGMNTEQPITIIPIYQDGEFNTIDELKKSIENCDGKSICWPSDCRSKPSDNELVCFVFMGELDKNGNARCEIHKVNTIIHGVQSIVPWVFNSPEPIMCVNRVSICSTTFDVIKKVYKLDKDYKCAGNHRINCVDAECDAEAAKA